MAFEQKTWVDRVVQYPLRRLLTIIRGRDDTGTEIVDIQREEGTITTEGDAFSAENMNDLEQRIADAFEDTGGGNFVGTQAEWNALTTAEKAKFDKSTGATVNITDDDIPDDIIGTEDISDIADGTLTGVAVKHEEDIASLNSALNNLKIKEIQKAVNLVTGDNTIDLSNEMPDNTMYFDFYLFRSKESMYKIPYFGAATDFNNITYVKTMDTINKTITITVKGSSWPNYTMSGIFIYK